MQVELRRYDINDIEKLYTVYDCKKCCVLNNLPDKKRGL